ncbi:hypothetical protein BKA67DRAFT_645614 [Truncatella angustata]|uniref:Zn(2)-C6 fungal-type domain-containing protein n=1 Tax=Truncatella angustata TaxID=152316 RepID=A0A9P8UKB8_9PEZI|nr:uncharacterized protein BKA67DRAFT_645614 [Truncatella angustata]KAH6653789.1 hypothetical protein BKA67DRAFT_645614 [Truncatella angustata]
MNACVVQKACVTCSRTKRKCGKQRPSCERCASRSIRCTYSTSKTNRFVLLVEPILTETPTSTEVVVSQLRSPGLILRTPPLQAHLDPPLLYGLSIPSGISHHFDSLEDRFLSSETWVVDHRPMNELPPVGFTAMERHVLVLQQWLNRWVDTGSNPFIHSHLYSSRFPSSIQMAYVTLSSYLSRTNGNKEIVLRIVQDRADELLRDKGAILDQLGPDATPAAKLTDILDQLSYLHSLLVYQIICLFDGDARLRHVAESRLFVLSSWATQLIESAGQVFSQLSLSGISDTEGITCLPNSIIDKQWYCWALAESVRRTWMVSMVVYAGYFMMQQGWALCPGGMMFTNGKGLWNAGSADEWHRLYSLGDARFLQRFDAERLFTEAKSADIDEFGKVMLEITFGTEKMENWD